jgi:hypothetical protein
MTEYDPRTKLDQAHMVLYRLAHDQFVDKISMGIALRDLDEFIALFERNERVHPCVFKMKELLLPGRKIIELHLADESSIKEIIEVALADFNKAVDMIGDVLQKKIPEENTD